MKVSIGLEAQTAMANSASEYLHFVHQAPQMGACQGILSGYHYLRVNTDSYPFQNYA